MSGATSDDGELVRQLFSSVGICERVPESQQDAFTGMAGSGPAYIYTVIEALSDGGVRMGLPRQLSARLAAQVLALWVRTLLGYMLGYMLYGYIHRKRNLSNQNPVGPPLNLSPSYVLSSLLQMTMGAAKMTLESGKHTGQLKDDVTSPSGTTIRGIQVHTQFKMHPMPQKESQVHNIWL